MNRRSRLFNLFSSCCVATILAQAIGLAWLWHRGMLSESRRTAIWIAAYGLSLPKPPAETEQAVVQRPSAEQSYLQTLATRRDAWPLLATCRNVLTEETTRVVTLDTNVRKERDRYTALKLEFDDFLRQQREQAKREALDTCTQTLMAIVPRQAKEQLVLLIQRDESQGQVELKDEVAMLKEMPLDRRRKILAEFRSEEEKELLHRLLVQLRSEPGTAAEQGDAVAAAAAQPGSQSAGGRGPMPR